MNNNEQAIRNYLTPDRKFSEHTYQDSLYVADACKKELGVDLEPDEARQLWEDVSAWVGGGWCNPRYENIGRAIKSFFSDRLAVDLELLADKPTESVEEK